VPSDLLQPKEMEEVLMDMVVVDSYSDAVIGLNSRDKKTEWFSTEADKVLAIRKISKDKFLKSYDFYKGRPDLFKVIIDTLQNRTQRNKDKIYDAKKFKYID
jgi:hypothetical protein